MKTSVYMILTLIILFPLMGIVASCRPTRVETEKTIEGTLVNKHMNDLGRAFTEMTPSEEEEGLVVNHMQKLWHYLSVTSNTKIVIKQVLYSGWGEQTETITIKFQHPSLGTILITAIDEDMAEQPGAETGTIVFVEHVEKPEPGLGEGKFYPFGAERYNTEVPPSFELKLPGGYFVPAGGLHDWTKRYLQDESTISILQIMVHEVFDFVSKEVSKAP